MPHEHGTPCLRERNPMMGNIAVVRRRQNAGAFSREKNERREVRSCLVRLSGGRHSGQRERQ
jgi:hypothetical protein